MNTASSQFCNSKPTVLYGTEYFQVRLWTLAADETLTDYPLAPTKQSQSFLISGQILTDNQLLPMGQRVLASSDASLQLKNTGKQPATLLEICQGDGFQPMPLAEVTETRPWGSFTVLKDESHYKLKQLIATPGNRLSLQRHQHREEHWLIMQGHPEITLDQAKIHLKSGDYIKIPRHSWHRLTNPAQPGTGETVEIIELQLGSYFGEDDIERKEDDYGRT